jgi:hypothetical protein
MRAGRVTGGPRSSGLGRAGKRARGALRQSLDRVKVARAVTAAGAAWRPPARPRAVRAVSAAAGVH